MQDPREVVWNGEYSIVGLCIGLIATIIIWIIWRPAHKNFILLAALDIPGELAQVALVGSLHRVKLGPFADQAEAGSWLEKARAALGITAIRITP